MAKRTILKTIGIILFLFIFIVFASEKEIINLFTFLVLLLLPLFLILNGRRYIKHRKWYVSPFILWSFTLDEKTTIEFAWIELIFGILILIFVMIIGFIEIFD